ncbi:hypothetical protein M128_0620 [Bacteroides fragilis str. S6L8]|nr:hypothetical protein M105_0617 [Bacteroides fragilis str. 1009-4-F \
MPIAFSPDKADHFLDTLLPFTRYIIIFATIHSSFKDYEPIRYFHIVNIHGRNHRYDRKP